MPQTRQRRKLHAVIDEVGLERDERMELAQFLLRRDVRSYDDLEDDQVSRLLDACEGYQLISQLLAMRPTGPGASADHTGSAPPRSGAA